MDCPELLEEISFSISYRTLRSLYSFYLKVIKINYHNDKPMVRALSKLNRISRSLDVNFAFPRSRVAFLLESRDNEPVKGI